MNILEVKNLSVEFSQDNKPVEVVKNISFQLPYEKITALVGQSGSGKSMTALSIINLVRKAKISGEILFKERNILGLDNFDLCGVRGGEIGFVFQDPSTSLNPLHTIGSQVAEAIKIHHPRQSDGEIMKRTVELFNLVELKDLLLRLDHYPHQLSGGQKQRVMIAMALANDPNILIADEPTTALDVTVADDILKLLLKLKTSLGLTILFITHNLRIVKKIADHVIVLKDGDIVEKNTTQDIFDQPQHEYTKLLMKSAFSAVKRKRSNLDKGTVLEVKDITVSHMVKNAENKKEKFFANKDIHFALNFGENLGIIGESGSGKSTLALVIAHLMKSKGEVLYFGKKAWSGSNVATRKEIQIVFQDPFSSLNPRMRVLDIISEGLIIHKMVKDKRECENIVDAILAKMKFSDDIKYRYPHELSGGQRQRVAIARSLVLNPKVLVLDEPTSALDIVTQNEILTLLVEIQSQQEISYILISHDLNVVSQISDQILVLKKGEIVEYGQKDKIIHHASDPYTQKLVSFL